MNQRGESRFQANQSVAITIFGEPDIRLSARIRNFSGRGIGIELEGPVAAGTALKIELEDALMLGEVIYCRPDERGFYVGVQLEQVLTGLGELSRMVSAFADPVLPDSSHTLPPESSRAQQADAVVQGCHQNQQQSHQQQYRDPLRQLAPHQVAVQHPPHRITPYSHNSNEYESNKQ